LGASDKEFLEIDLHLTSTDFKRVDKQADLNHHTDIEVLLGRFDLEGILDGVYIINLFFLPGRGGRPQLNAYLREKNKNIRFQKRTV
jgi:hypothetical protein